MICSSKIVRPSDYHVPKPPNEHNTKRQKSKPKTETKGTNNFLGPICPVYSRQIYNKGTARVKLHNLKTIRK